MKCQLRNIIPLLLFVTFGLSGQTKSKPSFGIGPSFGISYLARMPFSGITSINFIAKKDKHEFNISADGYQLEYGSHQRIFGIGAGYKYSFNKHFFTSTNIHYTRFACGFVTPAKYDYANRQQLESEAWPDQTNTFLSSICIGVNQRVFNFSEIYFCVGGGLNYYHVKSNDEAYTIHGWHVNPEKGNNFKFMDYFKIGWNFFIQKPQKKVKKEKPEEIPWD